MSQIETKLMTPEEHTGIYGAVAETIVREDLDLDERVERGVLHLDEHFPGWADKINLEKFQITSASDCIIGQMCGEYYDPAINQVAKIYPQEKYEGVGWEEDDPKLDKFAADHGFMSHCTSDEINDWNTLQESWVRAIKARQTDAV